MSRTTVTVAKTRAASTAATAVDAPTGSATLSKKGLNANGKRQRLGDFTDSSDDDEDDEEEEDTGSFAEEADSSGGVDGPIGDNESTVEDQTGANGVKKRIPAFVRKLRSMLDNKDVQHIKWSPDGDHFRVYDSVTFSRDVLPNYFKHNNWQSFIRQLNIYGFIKLTYAMHHSANLTPSPSSSTNGTGHPQSDWSFKHPLFTRKFPRRMEEIKRRAPKTPKPLDLESAFQASRAASASSQTSKPSSAGASANGKAAGVSIGPASVIPSLPSPTAAGIPTALPAMTAPAVPSTAATTAAVPRINGTATKLTNGSNKLKSSASSTSSTSSHGGTASTGTTAVDDEPLPTSVAPGQTMYTKPPAGPPVGVTTRTLRGRNNSGTTGAGNRKGFAANGKANTASSRKTSAASVKQQEPQTLEAQVKSLQGQISSMNKRMKDMAEAQQRAIGLTVNVLATQLEGQDSSVASINELVESLNGWRSACAKAATAPQNGALMLRLRTKRKGYAYASSGGEEDEEYPTFEGDDDDDEPVENSDSEMNGPVGLYDGMDFQHLPQVHINGVGMVMDEEEVANSFAAHLQAAAASGVGASAAVAAAAAAGVVSAAGLANGFGFHASPHELLPGTGGVPTLTPMPMLGTGWGDDLGSESDYTSNKRRRSE